MAVKRIVLAKPRGFCAGVEMAIHALEVLLDQFGAPIYCYHEIVHNKHVVASFESKGVIFVNSIDDVPHNSVIMLSAHGSAPEVVRSAREKSRFSVDAVCPLVSKVHHEIRKRSEESYELIYVGHEGHDEAVAAMSIAPSQSHLVENVDDVDKLEIAKDVSVALLTQTTLAESSWLPVRQAVLNKFDNVWLPGKSDMCFATTNRQLAVSRLAEICDFVLIVGSDNSSNTMALLTTAATVINAANVTQSPKTTTASNVFRVDSASELPTGLYGTVGITSGASAPEYLVDEIVNKLDCQEVEVLTAIHEEEYFPLPVELRRLISTHQ